MKGFIRLVRYGLPYSLQWLPGVLLLAMVGVLDTFRILLLQPIFDQVLRPDAPEGPILLGLPKSPWHFDLRALIPHFLHMHNAWTVVATSIIAATIAKGSVPRHSATSEGGGVLPAGRSTTAESSVRFIRRSKSTAVHCTNA